MYKIHIYDIIDSTIGSTSEPWIDNFSSSMTGPILIYVYILNMFVLLKKELKFLFVSLD